MQENKNDDENLVDFKGTIESFIRPEPEIVTQEEAIKAYKGEEVNFYKRKNNSSNDDETSEEEEHLKRIKIQLLESLERVNKLEKSIFNEKIKNSIKKSIKVNEKEKNKELIIEQMRQNVKNQNLERSREE